MKKTLTVIIILAGNISIAQSPTEQKATQFDKFINRPEIEWAAYINDTIRFEKTNLNKILLERLAKDEIKASLPAGSGNEEANHIRYQKKKEIDRIKFHVNEVAAFDSEGNMIGVKYVVPRFDTASFTLTHATQILYVEKGRVKSYVPWVSAMIPVVTSSGIYLGDGDYFSSCFNFQFNYIAGKQNKIRFLAQSRRMLSLDSFDIRSKLKELYGRNLVQSLWPYILKNRFVLFDVGKNNILKAEELDFYLVNEQKITVPVYDVDGNVTGSKPVSQPLSPDVFTKAELIQNWFYDQTRNIVFNYCMEMILYAKKWTSTGEEPEASPILKIVFK